VLFHSVSDTLIQSGGLTIRVLHISIRPFSPKNNKKYYKPYTTPK